MRLLLIVAAGLAVALAVGFGLTWLQRLLYRPQHDGGRLRVEVDVLSETVPYRPVQGRPPWVPWDFDPVRDGGWVSGAMSSGPGNGWRHYERLRGPEQPHEKPWVTEMPRIGAPEVHHDEFRRLPGEGEAGPGTVATPPVPGPVPAVDAREGPAVAAWLRVAARSDGVAAWFARELVAGHEAGHDAG